MSVVLGAVIVVAFLFLLLRSSYGSKIKSCLTNTKKEFLAKFLDRFSGKYNERMHHRKSVLIRDSLGRLGAEAGRPLTILEIGAGTGANFEFYPDGTNVTCLEPNNKTEPYLRKNVEKFPSLTLDKIHFGFAENMERVGSSSVDAVICTLVLCSVKDIDQCLKEVIRVLKPNGKFIFLEHVATRDRYSLLGIVQFLLRKPWLLLTGCRVAHETEFNIRKAGFSSVEIDFFEAVEMLKPKPLAPLISGLVKYHISGLATK